MLRNVRKIGRCWRLTRTHLRGKICSHISKNMAQNNNTVSNRSGDFPELRPGKPGVQWGSFPEWSSSWSRHLHQSVPTEFKPKWGTLQSLNVFLSKNSIKFFSFVWLRPTFHVWETWTYMFFWDQTDLHVLKTPKLLRQEPMAKTS